MEKRRLDLKEIYVCSKCGNRVTRKRTKYPYNPIVKKCRKCGGRMQKVVVLDR